MRKLLKTGGVRAGNVFSRVTRRELLREGAGTFKRRSAGLRLKNFKIVSEFDAHDPNAKNIKLSFMKRRSRIAEVVGFDGLVFALSQSGVCCAFDRASNRRLCLMNSDPDEVVRSIFVNKVARALITVSVFRHDNFSTLHCRSTPFEYIKHGKPELGLPLFEDECLKWPGFVEFDDINHKVLTFSSSDRVYRVWDMLNYTKLYEIHDEHVSEIKISPGVMMLVFERKRSHLPVKILNIETGAPVRSLSHLISRSRKIEFVEHMNDHMLFKQEGEPLVILNVRTNEVRRVPDFPTPQAFIFLYENGLFLTFRNRQVLLWNFRGEVVARFEDHELFDADYMSTMYLGARHDVIMSLCRMRSGAAAASSSSSSSSGSLATTAAVEGTGAGTSNAAPASDADIAGTSRGQASINLSDVLTGALCGRVRACSAASSSSSAPAMHPLATEDVTALYFDEERNEIYTGSASGLVHVWTN